MPTNPIDFEESNDILLGPSESDVMDLPIYRDEEIGTCVSCWKAPLKDRIKFLFLGEIWLGVKGRTHPPLWVSTKYFERKIFNVKERVLNFVRKK